MQMFHDKDQFGEFCRRHQSKGCPALPIRERGSKHVLLFPTGAEASCDLLGWQLREPPTDPFKLLKAKRRYHQEFHDRIQTDLRQLGNGMRGLFGAMLSGFKWPQEYGLEPKNRHGNSDASAMLDRLNELAEEHKWELDWLDEQLAKYQTPHPYGALCLS